jgi:hypothetical protein
METTTIFRYNDPMLWKGYVLANLCSFRNVYVASSNETHSWILLEGGVEAAKVVSMCVKTGIPLMDPLSLLTIISIYN